MKASKNDIQFKTSFQYRSGKKMILSSQV